VSSDTSSMLTREELLGGLPARRASMLLFAIENRTAHVVARSRRAMAAYISERTAEDQEREFLEALAQGREPPIPPTIQDLERYAPEWASLVPPDPAARAEVARMLGEKYTVPRRSVPRLRLALGLDDSTIAQAFERLHAQPIDSIYTKEMPWRERFQWTRARSAHRLETLPPFWTAYALTLTETVGSGILALPIALATVGPIAGVLVIIVLGLVSMLTIAAMAEAVARNGNVRYSRAYFGRMVHDYLGPTGTLILTPTLLLLSVVVLLSYFIGLPVTLADATGVGPELWAAVLFLVILFFLRRENISATVASALIVGTVSIALIVLLSLVSLPDVTLVNLRHVQFPLWNGQQFDSSILELIFGVVLCAFFGHTTTANCAAVVLEKDPSARSLIYGAAIAMATALGLYSLWIVAVNGAVPWTALAGERGTALGPLADQVGSSVYLFGIMFVILAMGMASIHVALGLAFQVRDWLSSVDAAPTNRPSDSCLFSDARSSVSRLVSNSLGRSIACMAPTFFIFVLAEGLMFSNRESFSALFGFLGVITVPIVAGVFSMLTLYAARKKGDCAVGASWRFLGHRVVVAGICLVFIASIVVHGIFVWHDPLRRIIALFVSVAIILFVLSVRRSAFLPRAVIELRLSDERQAEPVVSVVARGRTEFANTRWSENDRTLFGRNGHSQDALIHLHPLPVRELKIWVHRLTSDGMWQSVPARVAIQGENDGLQLDLDQASGQVVVQTDGESKEILITHLGDGAKRGSR
jgi:amino acid permease